MKGPLAPGGLLWLLGFEIRIYWRGLFGAKGENPWPRIALIAILGAVGLAFGFMMAMVLGALEPNPDPPPLLIVIMSLIMAVPASLMVSQAVGSVINAAYTRGDLGLLFSSPISPWTVSLSRALGVALNVSLLYLGILLCILVWAPFTGALVWLPLAPTVFALAMLATGAGMLLALGLMRLIGPRYARMVSQVLAGLMGAGFFIGFQSFNMLPDEREEALLAQGLATLRTIVPSPWNPLWAPARALLGDAPSQLATFFAGAGFLALATFLFSRTLAAHVAAVEGLSSKPAKARAGLGAFRQGVIANLVHKEWRLLRRDPMLLFQISLQLAYLIPLMIVMAANLGDDPGGAAIANSVFASLCVLIASSLAGGLVWLTASAEDAPELIGAAPVGRGLVEAAKFFAAVIPVAVLNLLPAGLFAVGSPFAGLVVALAGAGAACTAALLGVWYQRPGNRREFRRQRQTSWIAALGQAITTMAWSAATGLIIGGLAIWASIPLILIAITVFVLEDARPRGARDVGAAPAANAKA